MSAPDLPQDPSAKSAAPGEAPPGNARDAFQRVFEQVYGQLRAMAQQQMSHERRAHTLGATELVHQAYVRLVDGAPIDPANRAHFVCAVAEAMRRILIEHARRRARAKHGGDRTRVTLAGLDVSLPDDADELLALDEALRRLEETDARAGEVVRLRFFAGLTIEQTAEAMDLSPRTVKREWEWARAWLARQLK